MTRADRYRAWLAQHQPATMQDAREALGLTPKQMHTTIGELRRAGYVTATGPVRCRVYALTAKPGRTPRSREANRERMERRRREAGALPQAERKALTAQRKAARLAAREARRLEAQAERAEARRVIAVNRAAKAKAVERARLAAKANAAPVSKAKPVRLQAAPVRAVRPSQPSREAASTEAFIAAGGDYEILPNGASATPLRFLGFRDFTNNFRGKAA